MACKRTSFYNVNDIATPKQARDRARTEAATKVMHMLELGMPRQKADAVCRSAGKSVKEDHQHRTHLHARSCQIAHHHCNATMWPTVHCPLASHTNLVHHHAFASRQTLTTDLKQSSTCCTALPTDLYKSMGGQSAACILSKTAAGVMPRSSSSFCRVPSPRLRDRSAMRIPSRALKNSSSSSPAPSCSASSPTLVGAPSLPKACHPSTAGCPETQ